jgi:hypothetical protein
LSFGEGVKPALIHCPNCEGEVEEGRSFCPHCGKPVAPNATTAGAEASLSTSDATETTATSDAAPSVASSEAAASVVAEPTRAAPLPSFGAGREEGDKTRRLIFVAVAVLAALLIAGFAYLAMRPSARPGEEHLAGALRPGSPEYPPGDKLIVDFDPDEDATIGANALGNYVVTMKPTVRNFTGRTVVGLEFHASGLDLQGQTIRERTFVAEEEIEPNRTASPAIGLNFPSDNRPAQLKLELTGVRFK